MSETPELSDIGGQTGRTPPPGEPMHDVYPAMDARFILVDLGKLTAKVDRLTEDVSKISPKLDKIQSQVSFVKGAAWVLGGLIIVVGSLVSLIVSGKLSISLH